MNVADFRARIKKIEIVNKTLADSWSQSIKVILEDIELTNDNLLELRRFRPNESVDVIIKAVELNLFDLAAQKQNGKKFSTVGRPTKGPAPEGHPPAPGPDHPAPGQVAPGGQPAPGQVAPRDHQMPEPGAEPGPGQVPGPGWEPGPGPVPNANPDGTPRAPGQAGGEGHPVPTQALDSHDEGEELDKFITFTEEDSGAPDEPPGKVVQNFKI